MSHLFPKSFRLAVGENESRFLRPEIFSLKSCKFVKAMSGEHVLTVRLFPGSYLVFACRAAHSGLDMLVMPFPREIFDMQNVSLYKLRPEGHIYRLIYNSQNQPQSSHKKLEELPGPVLHYILWRSMSPWVPTNMRLKLHTFVFEEKEVEEVANVAKTVGETVVAVTYDEPTYFAKLFRGEI